MDNATALTREIKAFVVKESAFGTLAFPSATDVIGVLGAPQVSQEEEFVDSREIVESRSTPDRAWVGTAAGSFSLQVYARPSGAAGTPPVEDVLLEAALGAKTVNAGTSVVYSPALELPSFTLAFREGHTTNFIVGAKVGELRLSITRKDFATWDVSGSFQKVLRAGTAETAGTSTTTVIQLESGGAKLFDVGARVQVGTENNSGAGYEITAVDTSADTITLGTALSAAPAAGEVVSGYLPTASLSGHHVTGCEGSLSLDGAELTVTGIEVALSNALQPDDEELSAAGYVTAIDEGQRQVSGTINARYRRTYAAWFRRAREQEQGALVATAGETAGKRLKIELPLAQMNTPSTDGDEYRRNISVTLVGMPSASLEDEIQITYD